MTDGRFVDAWYCDDIRYEQGNKMTLVGCYGPDLYVGEFPVALARLCVYARAFTPVDRPFERLVFRLCLEQSVLAELPVDLAASRGAAIREDARWMMVNAALTVSPFYIEGPSRLRVEVETEDGSIVGPQLVLGVAREKAGKLVKPARRARRSSARKH